MTYIVWCDTLLVIVLFGFDLGGGHEILQRHLFCPSKTSNTPSLRQAALPLAASEKDAQKPQAV